MPSRSLIVAAVLLAVTAVSAFAVVQRQRARWHVPDFFMSGDVVGALRPGVSRPIRMKLTNPHRYPLRLKAVRVTVTVDADHRARGCAASNFTVRQLRRHQLPILSPRSSRAPLVMPVITMRAALLRNQDACQGARLRLRYSGRAVRARGLKRAIHLP